MISRFKNTYLAKYLKSRIDNLELANSLKDYQIEQLGKDRDLWIEAYKKLKKEKEELECRLSNSQNIKEVFRKKYLKQKKENEELKDKIEDIKEKLYIAKGHFTEVFMYLSDGDGYLKEISQIIEEGKNLTSNRETWLINNSEVLEAVNKGLDTDRDGEEGI